MVGSLVCLFTCVVTSSFPIIKTLKEGNFPSCYFSTVNFIDGWILLMCCRNLFKSISSWSHITKLSSTYRDKIDGFCGAVSRVLTSNISINTFASTEPEWLQIATPSFFTVLLFPTKYFFLYLSVDLLATYGFPWTMGSLKKLDQIWHICLWDIPSHHFGMSPNCLLYAPAANLMTLLGLPRTTGTYITLLTISGSDMWHDPCWSARPR